MKAILFFVFLISSSSAIANFTCANSQKYGPVVLGVKGSVMAKFDSTQECINHLTNYVIGGFICFSDGDLESTTGKKIDSFNSIESCRTAIRENARGGFYCSGLKLISIENNVVLKFGTNNATGCVNHLWSKTQGHDALK